jgi:seryl-tRNA synthetase
MRVSDVDDDSLSDIGEEMHLSVSQVTEMKEALERRQALLVRLQAERERYEYLLNRANEEQHQKLMEHNEKLRNTIEKIRVRVDASGLSDEEKGTLLLRLHVTPESETSVTH